MSNKRKRKARTSSGVRKGRAGKNVARDGRLLLLNKFERRSLDASWPGDWEKQQYFEFHEKDRRDRKGRLNRLKRAKAMALKNADRPDAMKTPMLEKAIKDLDSARNIQNLLIAAGLKYQAKKGWPFFYLKRTAKLGRRPITLAGLA